MIEAENICGFLTFLKFINPLLVKFIFYF